MKKLLIALMLTASAVHAGPHLSLDLTGGPFVVAGYGFASHKAVAGTGYPFLDLDAANGNTAAKFGLFALGGGGFRFGPGVWFPCGQLGGYIQNIATALLPKQDSAGSLDWLKTAGQYVSVGAGYIPAIIGSGPSDLIVMGQVKVPLGAFGGQ